MSDPAGLNSIVADLQMAFGGKIQRLYSGRPTEVYLETGRDSIAAIAAHLYKLRKIRLAMVFGIDRRKEEEVFYLQYTFACDRAGGFILVRTPVPATDPEFPSLTPVIPAVNWQEREIQDWFGLTAVGHPNPRRVALHDDFPDRVHPLRKDFDLFSRPLPLPGPRHLFRPVEGEGVFQVPVGPIHAGIIEPGHFRFSVAGEPVCTCKSVCFTPTRPPRNSSSTSRSRTRSSLPKAFQEIPASVTPPLSARRSRAWRASKCRVGPG